MCLGVKRPVTTTAEGRERGGIREPSKLVSHWKEYRQTPHPGQKRLKLWIRRTRTPRSAKKSAKTKPRRDMPNPR